MENQRSDQLLRYLIGIFIVSGTLSSLYFSDDYDELRVGLTVFFAIPCLTSWLLAQKYWVWPLQAFPRSRVAVGILTLAVFGWGNFLLLNALSDNQTVHTRTRVIGPATVSMSYYQGAFGHLYKTRW